MLNKRILHQPLRGLDGLHFARSSLHFSRRKCERYAKIMIRLFTIFILCFMSFGSFAFEKPTNIEMKGVLKIWGKESAGDELPGVSLFITGEAAEKLYKELKVKAVKNECFDDGTLTKHLGSFECSFSKKYNYTCSVGLGFKEQKMFYSESC